MSFRKEFYLLSCIVVHQHWIILISWIILRLDSEQYCAITIPKVGGFSQNSMEPLLPLAVCLLWECWESHFQRLWAIGYSRGFHWYSILTVLQIYTNWYHFHICHMLQFSTFSQNSVQKRSFFKTAVPFLFELLRPVDSKNIQNSVLEHKKLQHDISKK